MSWRFNLQRIYNFLIVIRKILDFFSDGVFSLIALLQPFFKKDVYFFRDTWERYTELIDSYTLFEYMHSKGFECYYIVDKAHPLCESILAAYPKNIITLNNDNIMGSLHIRHFTKFLRLKIYFSAWGYEVQTPSFHEFVYNNKRIDYIFLQHGVTLLKSFVFDLYNNTIFNKILVSNEYEKEIVKKYMGYNERNIIKAAMPRFERLNFQKEKPQKRSIAFFMTWRLSFKTIDYKKSKYYERINSLLDNKRLNALIEKYDVKINLITHHALLTRDSEFSVRENFETVNSLEASKYIKEADMLITDYSSVWADFFFQQKPVVFYRLDYGDPLLIEQDKKDAEFAKLSDEILFNVCYDEEKVVDLVEKYIKNNFELEEENKKITDKFFYCKENICQKIVEELR